MLEHGCDHKAIDVDGHTPLHFCSLYGRAKTAKTLVINSCKTILLKWNGGNWDQIIFRYPMVLAWSQGPFQDTLPYTWPLITDKSRLPKFCSWLELSQTWKITRLQFYMKKGPNELTFRVESIFRDLLLCIMLLNSQLRQWLICSYSMELTVTKPPRSCCITQ